MAYSLFFVKIIRLRQFLTVCFLCLAFAVSAQKPTLVFHHISVDDGLSDNTVRAIIEDKKGFVWFGCEDGLNKFDGYEFKIYRNDNKNPYSITSRSIKYLYLDSKGRLWVLTSNGLNLYDAVKDCFYNYKNTTYTAFKELSSDIAGIIEDNKGNIWVSTVDEGIFKIECLDKPAKRFNYFFNDNSKHFLSLIQDTDSTLLVGTTDGLLNFNVHSGQYYDLRPRYGKGYEVRSVYIDNDHVMYISTSKGLKVIDKKGLIKEYRFKASDHDGINGDNVMNVVPYKNGNYLIGIDGGGIDWFDVKQNKFYHYTDELSSPNINCLYKDTKDDIWAGTFLNGVNYSNPTTNLFVLNKNNPISDYSIKKGIVSSFLKDSKGNLWVTADGGGLYKKTKGSDRYKHYQAGEKSISSNVVISIMEDEEGYLWITTYGGGLLRYDAQKDVFKNYKSDPLNPNALFNDHTKALCDYQGKIWVSGFGSGVDVLDKNTDQFTHYAHDDTNKGSIASDWVQAFYKDRKGVLWLATFRGLCRYNPKQDNFTTFTFNNKSSNNHLDANSLIDITEDSKGKLWLATTGNGVMCFDKEKYTYTSYTTADGLSNDYTKSIIEDDQSNIWISSNNGITRIDLKTKKIKAYTIKDGIPPCSFFFNAKYKDEQGVIYLGTNKGFLKINPAMTGENKRIPPVLITKLEINNELVLPGVKGSPLKIDVSETEIIHLPYDQNAITFYFVALNFNSARNNKYAYYLEGFDEEWFMAGDQRSAKYTNLNPGRYVFRVKGSNNDNIWNEKGASVIVIISPPIWKTWWFIGICILLMVALLYLLYLWRIRVITNQNIQLAETVKERTAELEDANQRLETFVYKASHDIKGPLKSIIGLTTIGQKDVKDEVSKNYFDHILHSTKKLDNLLMDLLMVTKVRQTSLQLEKIDFEEMVREILDSFQNAPGYDKMNITTEIKCHDDFYSDKKLLHSVIQNLIENPIKYQDSEKSRSSLTIKITVFKNGQAELVFKDNGLGIKKEFQKQIFDMFFKANEHANGTGLGLYIVKTTVEKLKGTIRLESEEGKGSTFYVNL